MFRNTKKDDGRMVKLMMDPNHSQLSIDNPIFSPLFGSFEGFPPMYINVGTAEVLEDDATRVLKESTRSRCNCYI